MNQTSLVGRPLYALTSRIATALERRTSGWSGPLTSSSPELARLWGSPSTSTGVHVDESSAYTSSVFWACVNNISTDIGSFPLNLYKREPDGGKALLPDHKLQPLLHDSPNPEMSAFTFRALLTSNALTWGMGYAEIVRNGAGQIVELWPITPDRVKVQRNGAGTLTFEVSRSDGRTNMLSKDQIFVLPGSTVDGVYGRNIVTMARESISLGLAAEKFGGTFFGNGATFGGVFEHPTTFANETALKNFRESVNTQHQGVERSHHFIVVQEGMKYQKLGVDPNAAQFLETRQHQIEEMCRWFRMPPHKVQHLIRTSYNSVEQMNIEYSTDTLTPWCVRWEQEVLRQLIAPSERRIQFVKHNMDSKLRGDTASRYQAYTQGIQNGFLSADDVREKEDMNPLPDGAGKKYFIQSNNQPLDRVDEIVDKQVAPDPKPVAPAPAAKDEEKDRQFAEALEQAIAASEARATELASKIAFVDAANRELTEMGAEREGTTEALRSELAAEQSAIVSLKAQFVDLTERADRLAAEREAERIAAEDLRKQVEDAHASAEAAKVVWADEATRLQALMDQQIAEAARLQSELEATATARAEAERDAKAFGACLDDAVAAAEQAKATAAAEIERVQQELAAMTARAAQVEADQRVMQQTGLAAELALTALRADLQAAEALYAETSTALASERGAVEAARAQVTELQVAIGDAFANLEATEAERVAQMAEAAASEAKAQDAHRVATEATEKLRQATADAEAARQRLEAETALVEAERVEKAALLAQMETQRQAHAARQQAVLSARRDQLLDTLSRQVRVEADRARRNQATPAKIIAWAEGFYIQREEQLLDALRPDMRSHLVFIDSTEDVDTYTRRLIAPQLLAAVQQIRTIAEGDSEDFAASLERLLTKWELERPVQIADRVFQEEMTYVRSL
jgi:HK97 family phage portal protein